MNTQEFILKARKVHGDKYNYSKVEYVNNRTKVCIICPEHGEFWQTPKNHLKGHGCRECGYEISGNLRKYNKQDFVNKAKEIHGDKYDYSKVEYLGAMKKVCIICHRKDKFGNEHGEFWQEASSHLRGNNCPICSNHTDAAKAKELFFQKMAKIHPDLDFSKALYKGVHEKTTVICHKKDEFGNEHGEFQITPHNLLMGWGCRKCSGNYLDRDLFIKRANVLHNDKYDYSKVEYKGNKTKVCIICPEHGEFWQVPNSHLSGRGCPFCKTSHIEREMKKILESEKINYVYQYHDNNIFGKQSLDFYIPEKKIAIECQSEIHYIPNFYKSKGKEFAVQQFEYRKGLDEHKRQICKENGIQLIYFMDKIFLSLDKSDTLKFSNKEDLLKYLKAYENNRI